MLKEAQILIWSSYHKNDPRISFLRFFKKTKINELPQLFNILLGSMSIIGPRPLVDKILIHIHLMLKKRFMM